MGYPKYSVYQGEVTVPGGGSERVYFIRCHNGEPEVDGGIIKGKAMLMVGNGFMRLRDPHDAIVVCQMLNNQEESK